MRQRSSRRSSSKRSSRGARFPTCRKINNRMNHTLKNVCHVNSRLGTNMGRLHFLTLITMAIASTPLFAIDDYVLGPDSMVKEGVPKGKVVEGVWVSDN